MEALINMICDLKITSGSEKNCVKISWWSDIPLKSYQRKTVLRGHEIHSSVLICINDSLILSLILVQTFFTNNRPTSLFNYNNLLLLFLIESNMIKSTFSAQKSNFFANNYTTLRYMKTSHKITCFVQSIH